MEDLSMQDKPSAKPSGWRGSRGVKMWLQALPYVADSLMSPPAINAQLRGASVRTQWWMHNMHSTCESSLQPAKSPLVKTARGKGVRERAVRTVSGSPCSACRMKLLTTRPSFMCILEPKVLKILATLTSTPSCERGKDVSRGLFGSLFFFFFFFLAVRAYEGSVSLA